ncbi:MAG: hypothetical protein HY289_01015 [Planctomycetes bacterium]|nr:hypothetical protein [Planctomycetota bacterium]
MAQGSFDWGGVKEGAEDSPKLIEQRARRGWDKVPAANSCIVVLLWVILVVIFLVAGVQIWAHSYRIRVPLTVDEWSLLLWHPLEGEIGRFPDGNSPLIIANYVRIAGTIVIDLCAIVMALACQQLGKASAAGCRRWCRLAALFLILGVGLVSLLAPLAYGATQLPVVGGILLNQTVAEKNEYLAGLVEGILFVSVLLTTISFGCYMRALRLAADELKMPAVGSSARTFFWTFATLHVFLLAGAWGTCALIYWLDPGARPEHTFRPAATKIWFAVWCVFSIITMLGCIHQCRQANAMIRGDLAPLDGRDRN